MRNYKRNRSNGCENTKAIEWVGKHKGNRMDEELQGASNGWVNTKKDEELQRESNECENTKVIE